MKQFYLFSIWRPRTMYKMWISVKIMCSTQSFYTYLSAVHSSKWSEFTLFANIMEIDLSSSCIYEPTPWSRVGWRRIYMCHWRTIFVWHILRCDFASLVSSSLNQKYLLATHMNKVFVISNMIGGAAGLGVVLLSTHCILITFFFNCWWFLYTVCLFPLQINASGWRKT